MNRSQKREVLATLIKAGRRDLAKQFVGAAGWEEKWVAQLSKFGAAVSQTNFGIEVDFSFPPGDRYENVNAFGKLARKAKTKGTKRYETDDGYKIVVSNPKAAADLLALMPSLAKQAASF